ncbi:hypothetical protein CLAIMM_04670 isoform 2 [Cladophialophora immunda]|nr:hypothetical protein CLAIMM_04670 isoform 2 [Cladophialophora immunda]
MNLMDMPSEIILAIIDRTVHTCELFEGLQLRLLNRFLNTEILRSYFVTRVVDFHSEAVVTKANAMGDVNAARLLQGHLSAVESYAAKLPWLLTVKSALQLAPKSRDYEDDVVHETIPEEEIMQRKIWIMSLAVTAYLGVPEVLSCLDPNKQLQCRYNHPTPAEFPYLKCKPWCVPFRGKPRRYESAFDWALLMVVYLGDVLAVQNMLSEHSEKFKSSPEIPPSFQLAARRKSVPTLRLLFDGLGDAADPDRIPSLDYGYPEGTTDNYAKSHRYKRWEYLKLARDVLAQAVSN